MLHNTRYKKESLLKLVSLLDSKEDILTYVKTHQTAIKYFESLADATPFLIYILQKTLEYYNRPGPLNSVDDMKLKSIIEILNPLLSREHDMESIEEFLTALNDRRGNCYTLDNCRLYFVRALSASIKNVDGLVKVINYLSTDEKAPFAKTMHHLIASPDDLTILIGKLPENIRLDMMNHVEGHWEIDYRTKCRMAFLSGSLMPESDIFCFFKGYTKEGKRGIPQLKKMILDFAELEPYHSPDNSVQETKYNLK